MNSSVLVEVISGFGKVSNQEENHEKNAENRSSKTLETIKVCLFISSLKSFCRAKFQPPNRRLEICGTNKIKLLFSF